MACVEENNLVPTNGFHFIEDMNNLQIPCMLTILLEKNIFFSDSPSSFPPAVTTIIVIGVSYVPPCYE